MTPRAPADQAIRDRITRDFDTTFLLEAGAGTGKTTVLVERILALVRTGRSTLDRIVAITFTEKAAGELKLRLRERLEESLAESPLSPPGGEGRGEGDPGGQATQGREKLSPEERTRVLQATTDLERAPVSTIHSFGMALLKERPFEAGLDPGFSVVADVTGERTFDDAFDAWLDARMSEGHPTLVRALHFRLKLDGLRKGARRVVAERDILRRATEASSFDRTSLVKEMERAVEELAPLKEYCTDPADNAYQALLDLEAYVERSHRVEGAGLESLLRSVNLNKLGAKKNWNPPDCCTQVKATIKEVLAARDAYIAASDADIARELRELLRSFLDEYENHKREGAVVDFEDLLLRTRDVLASSLSVRRYYQHRFDYLLVDEFQDTDPLQVQIAFFLAEDPEAAPADDWRSVQLKPGKLFVVGDPKQSIYRFRRADIAIYEETKRLIEESGGEVLPLTANFRTVPSIIGFVNERFDALFTSEYDPEPRPLNAFRTEVHKDGARTIALPLHPDRLPSESRTVTSLKPVLAETVAAFVKKITQDAPWSIRDKDGVRAARPGDVGLLVRRMTPDFIGPFEDELSKRGIGYRLVGGKEYYAREEVRGLAAVLRSIDNPADRLSLFAALRSAFFGFSDDELLRFVSVGGILNYQAPLPEAAAGMTALARTFELLTRLHRKRRVASPSEVIIQLFERTRALPAFRARPGGDQLVANLWKVLEVARAYEASGPATLRAVVRFLEEEGRVGREEGDSPVGGEAGAQLEILTVHKAKGLEYPIVIIADLLANRRPETDCIVDHAEGEGWLKVDRFKPGSWEEKRPWDIEQRDAEERRLLYVALTRARDHLVIPCLPGELLKGWLNDAIAGFMSTPSPPAEERAGVRGKLPSVPRPASPSPPVGERAGVRGVAPSALAPPPFSLTAPAAART